MANRSDLWTLNDICLVPTLHAAVDDNLNLEESQLVKQRIRDTLQDAQLDHMRVELEMSGQACSQLYCTPELTNSD